MKVTYCYLDDILQSPDDNLKYEDLFNEHDSAMLEQFNEIFKKDGIQQAMKFA